jgi:biotin carboxylase
MPRIMLLLPKTTYRAEAFLDGAACAGVGVKIASDVCHVLDAAWSATGSAYAEAAPLVIDFDAPDEAAARVIDACRAEAVEAIVPVTETGALVAAIASRALGLPYNAAEAAYAARNKRALREALAAASVPQPKYVKASLDDDPREVAARAMAMTAGGPCVVKPVLLSASRGVIRADDAAAIAKAMARVAAIVELPELFKVHDPDRRTILVEQFVPGAEVALEGVLTRGRLQTLALFDKPDPLDGPYFEETIYVTPSRLAAATQERIRAVTEAAARAMGLETGPIHAELRVRDAANEDPIVIEVAARSIGGLCARALRFAGGMSLEELVVRHAVGEDVTRASLVRGASGVMMIPIPGAGVLEGVRGIAEAAAVRGVEDVVIGAPTGTKLVPLPEGGSYLGFLFARGAAPADVEASLREAHARLVFDLAVALT